MWVPLPALTAPTGSKFVPKDQSRAGRLFSKHASKGLPRLVPGNTISGLLGASGDLGVHAKLR
mgnify:CR=1 FL=1|jgi:hypothetical protein